MKIFLQSEIKSLILTPFRPKISAILPLVMDPNTAPMVNIEAKNENCKPCNLIIINSISNPNPNLIKELASREKITCDKDRSISSLISIWVVDVNPTCKIKIQD